MSADLERALDELYAEAPDAFVRRRTELARSLKEAGDKTAAAAVEKARKPTATAWILNQLTRAHADDVADLTDAGRALARAQRKAMRGDGGDLKAAIARQRETVAALARKAAQVMSGLGLKPDEHMADVVAALNAALVDPAAGAALEEGRLAKLPEAGGGFPSVDEEEPELVFVKRKAPRGILKIVPKAAPDGAKETRRRRMLDDARAELKDAEEALAEAEQRAGEAREQADALLQEAARLREEAEHKEREAQDVDVEAADRAVDKAKAAVAREQSRVDSLAGSGEARA